MKLGKRLKEYREKNNMTQKDIAEILEVEPGTISKYELDIIEPKIESLRRLSDTFNVSLDELLKEDNDFDISKINVLKVLREQKEMKLKGNLYHDTQVSFAYNTNHIEGSKLTEEQTRYIYETTGPAAFATDHTNFVPRSPETRRSRLPTNNRYSRTPKCDGKLLQKVV